MGLWGIQVTVAVISLAETLLVTYLGYKVKFIVFKEVLVLFVPSLLPDSRFQVFASQLL